MVSAKVDRVDKVDEMRSAGAGSHRVWEWLGRLVVSAPAVAIGLLIYRFGVDIPHWDQWNGFCQLLEKQEQGTLGLADFTAAHNEHIILFPRLVMYGVAALTGWNTRAEMLVVWLLAVVCGLGIWQVARHTGWRERGKGTWLLLGASILLFSPQAHENWLWGFQLAFLMQAACAIGCIWAATSSRRQLVLPLTMAVCVVGSFSSAGGLVCWITAAPLLFIRREEVAPHLRRWWSAAWLAGLFLTTALVLLARHQPDDHPGFLGAITHLSQVLRFFLTYLGRGFAWGGPYEAQIMAPLVGAVLVVCIAGAAAVLWWWRRDADFTVQALPWFMVAATALSNATLASVGRYHMGLSQALSSRYVTFSVLLPVGLLFLGSLILRRSDRLCMRAPVRLGWGMVLVCLFLLHGMGSMATLADWRSSHRQRLRAKALVETINIVDQPSLLGRVVHAIVPPLRARMNTLNRLGYLRPPLVASKNINLILGETGRSAGAFGSIQAAGELANGQIGLSGWAVLPDKRRPADLVMLTLGDAATYPGIVAVAAVGWPLAERPPQIDDPAYTRSGWRIEFADTEIMREPRELRAWAFDAETALAYPLAGVVGLERSATPAK